MTHNLALEKLGSEMYRCTTPGFVQLPYIPINMADMYNIHEEFLVNGLGSKLKQKKKLAWLKCKS